MFYIVTLYFVQPMICGIELLILSARSGVFKNITRCFYKAIVDNEAVSKAPIVVFLLQSTDSLCHNWRFDDRKNIFV